MPNYKHGLRNDPIYGVWTQIIRRCTDPNAENYPDYGGRGIKVCERWRHSVMAFTDDMGPRPDGASIDRINNDGDYTPDNCKWSTSKEQAANRRSTKVSPEMAAAIKQEAGTYRQIAAKYGVSAATVSQIRNYR